MKNIFEIAALRIYSWCNIYSETHRLFTMQLNVLLLFMPIAVLIQPVLNSLKLTDDFENIIVVITLVFIGVLLYLGIYNKTKWTSIELKYKILDKRSKLKHNVITMLYILLNILFFLMPFFLSKIDCEII